MKHSENCIFCRIVAGTIPSNKVWENDHFLAFHDINPSAPVHILLIPKTHYIDLNDMAASADGRVQMAELLPVAEQLTHELGCAIKRDSSATHADADFGIALQGGFRLSMNNGPDGGQEVGHVHLHLLAKKSKEKSS